MGVIFGKLNIFVLFFCFSSLSCQTPAPEPARGAFPLALLPKVMTGAEQTEAYFPLLTGKRLGLVVNHTSRVGETHLVDTLLSTGFTVTTIFAPEHGFRGAADAGEHIADGRDPRTGLRIISLYGSHKEPTPADLQEVDLLIFDIQDVGARFYTYISPLHYVLQAGARNGVPVLVLDRPNPNGHYVDGPVLDPAFRSFVGMHPVPVVHGLTVGEYARMINGEGWLEDDLTADLEVIPCANYTHQTPYELPLPPSPNLPNMRAIYLYPSLCFFEGTVFNEGRGTDRQFQIYGHPDFSLGHTTYVPEPRPGARYPKLEGQVCRGFALSDIPANSIRQQARLDLSHLIRAYTHFPRPDEFFLPTLFIDKLVGSDQLRRQLSAGWTADQIRASWQADLEIFRAKRKAYLIYAE
jgi:uncharacterized protein YbbC (DUF1343 family)